MPVFELLVLSGLKRCQEGILGGNGKNAFQFVYRTENDGLAVLIGDLCVFVGTELGFAYDVRFEFVAHIEEPVEGEDHHIGPVGYLSCGEAATHVRVVAPRLKDSLGDLVVPAFSQRRTGSPRTEQDTKAL